MMGAKIGRETTAYSRLATKNASAIGPAKTANDWADFFFFNYYSPLLLFTVLLILTQLLSYLQYFQYLNL